MIYEDEGDLRAGLWLAGTDEAGRGCLAGPVYAAFVLGCPALLESGARDSKLLSPAARDKAEEAVRNAAVACAVASASPAEIGELNIRRATELAVARAYELLVMRAGRAPDLALVDGVHAPELQGARVETRVRGDSRFMVIAAASVLAKTARDRYMEAAAEAFPGYGWHKNKGYGTAEHLQGLRRLGKTPLHRPGFRMPGKEE